MEYRIEERKGILGKKSVMVSVDTPEEKAEREAATLGRLSRYHELLHDYIQIGMADMDRLGELITQAKGPSRSMRQFAEAVGVSPATMSRIMNQKTSGPLDKELLAKIAANADPQSGITLEMLLAANGDERKGNGTLASRFEDMATKAIVDEIMERGFSISKGPSEIRKGAEFGMRFDLELETNAIGSDDERPGKWLFEFKSGGTTVIDETHPPVGYGRFRQWLTMAMSLYYCGTADADRISYVTDRREIYEQARKALERVCIPDEISAILVQGGVVVDEYVAPTRGSEPRTILDKRERDEVKPSDEEETVWDMDAFSDDSSASRQAGGADGD